MVAERFGSIVMERQGILMSALTQVRGARVEARQRLSWALGEVGSRADVAMVTVVDETPPNPMSVSSSSMMG